MPERLASRRECACKGSQALSRAGFHARVSGGMGAAAADTCCSLRVGHPSWRKQKPALLPNYRTPQQPHAACKINFPLTCFPSICTCACRVSLNGSTADTIGRSKPPSTSAATCVSVGPTGGAEYTSAARTP